MAIPASGKTVLFESIESYYNEKHEGKTKLFIVSSDQVSLQLMNEHIAVNPNVTKEDAYQQTRKKYRTRYDNEIRAVCQKAQSCEQQFIVIIFDKNHPENALKGPLDIVKEYFKQFTSIGLIPKIGKPLGNNLFSITYLVSCVQRAIKRENHETLVGNKEKVASVVLFFFSFFNKVQIDKLPFNKVFYVPFTNEDGQMDQVLREEALELLKIIQREKNPEDIQNNCQEALQKFIGICEKYNLGFPDKNLQREIVWKEIQTVDQ
ncbi:unnamed protein product [Paramecium primaurelia]|uniref:Helicase/UvrB N-terminal domain-containing protein n=1 Tax=Paramecium primaurelia TaxID=5886 RepID=A0A8S1MAD2_PARPR|nr:unnamed protein product [Paramecium primaurelia]